jgi:hypothetical protein
VHDLHVDLHLSNMKYTTRELQLMRIFTYCLTEDVAGFMVSDFPWSILEAWHYVYMQAPQEARHWGSLPECARMTALICRFLRDSCWESGAIFAILVLTPACRFVQEFSPARLDTRPNSLGLTPIIWSHLESAPPSHPIHYTTHKLVWVESYGSEERVDGETYNSDAMLAEHQAIQKLEIDNSFPCTRERAAMAMMFYTDACNHPV